MPAARRSAALLGHVREEVARVLQLAPGQAIEPDRGLKELGLDSLMAVELRNRLQASTGRVWPTTLAFDHPTLGALVRHLEQELFSRAAATPAPTPSATDLDSTPEIGERLSDDAVADLSDEEASQLLLEEIARGRDAGQEVAGG
jgi:acyl carrier protein